MIMFCQRMQGLYSIRECGPGRNRGTEGVGFGLDLFWGCGGGSGGWRDRDGGGGGLGERIGGGRGGEGEETVV